MTNYDLINEYVKGYREYNAVNHIGYTADKLYSYSTVICMIDRERKKAKVNTRKYSRTTSRHIACLMSVLELAGYSIETYSGDDCFYWNYGYQGAECWKVSDFRIA